MKYNSNAANLMPAIWNSYIHLTHQFVNNPFIFNTYCISWENSDDGGKKLNYSTRLCGAFCAIFQHCARLKSRSNNTQIKHLQAQTTKNCKWHAERGKSRAGKAENCGWTTKTEQTRCHRLLSFVVCSSQVELKELRVHFISLPPLGTSRSPFATAF